MRDRFFDLVFLIAVCMLAWDAYHLAKLQTRVNNMERTMQVFYHQWRLDYNTRQGYEIQEELK